MKRMLMYVRPYLARMSLGLFVKFAGTIMDLALPWILAHLIDEVVPLGNRGSIFGWGVVMLICSVIAVSGNIIANRMASRVARDATQAIRHDLFKRITRLSARQIDQIGVPSLISRLTSDTYNMHRMLGMMQRLGVRAPILLLGGVTVTVMLDANLSLVLLATLPLIAIGLVLISRKGIPLYTLLQARLDGMVRVVRDDAMGIRVIKALSRTEREKSRFDAANRAVVSAERRAGFVMSATNPLMNLLLNLGLTAVVVTGAYLVNRGLSEPGKIIAFLTYFTIILNAMLSVNRMFAMYSQSSASAARIAQVLDMPRDMRPIDAPGEASRPPRAAPHIQFESVGFSYSGKEGRRAVDGISFTLEHGQTLGILGATGSGKSTLLYLLMRFYDPDEGRVLIDGRDVRAFAPAELSAMFGVTFQTDALFADTIYENIDFGRGLDGEAIKKAARCAQAAGFIESFPEGYERRLTQKATNLSGGQKQRLLIARALAARPSILILDDASSALDYQTDARLRAAISAEFPETTTILIAQRVSSLRHADKILVLEEGRMAALGAHEELMRTCPIYRETCFVQMGGESDAAAQSDQ